MIHLKSSMVFMMLLSVGTLFPADKLPEQASKLFGQVQTVGMDGWNLAAHMASGALGDAQRWANVNPKTTGVLVATIVCGCLFALWRKNFKRRVEKDLDEAWMDGYEVAQDECDEALEQELRVAQQQSYNAGWQSAMSRVHQIQQNLT